MLHQRYKDLPFLVIAKASVPNYVFRKALYGLGSGNGVRHLHLGCGPKYLPGFVNIDANPFHKIDMWLDVRNGLPFSSDQIESVYSTHTFEHFYPDELAKRLKGMLSRSEVRWRNSSCGAESGERHYCLLAEEARVVLR